MWPRVSVYVAVSLDGFIAQADGALDWLAPREAAVEDYGYAGFFAGIDTGVLGRATFDAALGIDLCPYAGRREVVPTHRPLVARHGEHTHAGALAPLLHSLGQAGARHVYLDRGQTICQALVEDLLDDMTLSWVPAVLGDGRPLFAEELPESKWTLRSARSLSSGLVPSCYRRAAG